MEKIYTTVKSKGILSMYWFGIIFILFMLIGVPTLAREEMKGSEQSIFYIVFTVIFIWFCWIMYKIYNMKYIVANGEITIHGAFNKNIVKIAEIEKIQRSPIPFGIRLFGGSFIGGRYYLPGIGKAWVAMTNFKDGVLIQIRGGENYLITPKDPDDFINFVSNQ